MHEKAFPSSFSSLILVPSWFKSKMFKTTLLMAIWYLPWHKVLGIFGQGFKLWKTLLVIVFLTIRGKKNARSGPLWSDFNFLTPFGGIFLWKTRLPSFFFLFSFFFLRGTSSRLIRLIIPQTVDSHARGGARIFCLGGPNFVTNILVSSQDKPSHSGINTHTQI